MQPIQPLVIDDKGVLRFQCNAIVRYLLDHGGIDLNDLAQIDFPQEDREQFAQLIGYSLSGFGDLSYVSKETYEVACDLSEDGTPEHEARIGYLHAQLQGVKDGLRRPIAELYGIHPDDLP